MIVLYLFIVINLLRFSKPEKEFLPNVEHKSQTTKETIVSFFSPFLKFEQELKGKVGFNIPPVISPPEKWITSSTDLIKYVDGIWGSGSQQGTVEQRARDAYANILLNFMNGLNYGKTEKAFQPANLSDTTSNPNKLLPLNRGAREQGTDWPYLGVTAAGSRKLTNLLEILKAVKKEGIEGNIMEVGGVWRGGSSIFLTGILKALKLDSRKMVIVSGVFAGFAPESEMKKDNAEERKQQHYLQVSEDQVIKHFQRFNLLSKNVYFLKGLTNHSMPFFHHYIRHHEKEINELGYETGIALLRLDGNMYRFIADVLYHMYEYVSVGGFIVIDDWQNTASEACRDFFQVHHLAPKIEMIDSVSAYWRKTEKITVQKGRYHEKNFD